MSVAITSSHPGERREKGEGALHGWPQNLSWMERGCFSCSRSTSTSASQHGASVRGPFPLGDGTARRGGLLPGPGLGAALRREGMGFESCTYRSSGLPLLLRLN